MKRLICTHSLHIAMSFFYSGHPKTLNISEEAVLYGTFKMIRAARF